jgi:hypothetical protein
MSGGLHRSHEAMQDIATRRAHSSSQNVASMVSNILLNRDIITNLLLQLRRNLGEESGAKAIIMHGISETR